MTYQQFIYNKEGLLTVETWRRYKWLPFIKPKKLYEEVIGKKPTHKKSKGSNK